jgi:hypothetical protein
MKKLLIPAMGVAAAFGAAQPAAADVQISQLMFQGQPGYTGNVNRTLPSGSAGIAPMNTPVGPSPYAVAPAPSYTPYQPFIGQRGELNYAEPESVSPGQRDASGKIGPTADRQRARFTGERGSDGKLLPTYGTQEAQATSPSQTTPQASPPTPAPSDMPSTQPTTRRPGSGAMSSPSSSSSQTGTTAGQSSSTTSQRHAQMQNKSKSKSGSMQHSGSMGSKSQNEMSETAALNALSAEGYTNVGKIQRVGGSWQTTAMKGGQSVTVQVDPTTNQITQR